MCDTFVATQQATGDGSIIFGKNSDREPNEAQVLEYIPAREYPSGSQVRCTYLEIPQVERTHAVMLSRPFWMWGAEMGSNEKGVVIGNEAVWTKMPLEREGRLTGMDLLRLGLERGDNAAGALEVITALLAEHGQGGPCGYEDRSQTYHNSFIIADPKKAWVLETAGPLWAARQVEGVYSISNGLTLGSELDLQHPDLISTARKKNWLLRGQKFDFRRSYSDWFYTTFSGSRKRRRRCLGLVQASQGRMDVPTALEILRDHGAEIYSPDSHLLMNRICAHSANRRSRHATQTTSSLVAHLKPDLQTYWVTGTAAPCISLFKPVRLEDKVLPDLGPSPAGTFNPRSLWWKHEDLHRSILEDYTTRSRVILPQRMALEREFLEVSERADKGEHGPVTREAFSRSLRAEMEWLRIVRSFPVQGKTRRAYRRYWKRQNRRAGYS